MIRIYINPHLPDSSFGKRKSRISASFIDSAWLPAI